MGIFIDEKINSVTGKPAFQAKDYGELLEENARGNIRTKGRRWLALSSDGIYMRITFQIISYL